MDQIDIDTDLEVVPDVTFDAYISQDIEGTANVGTVAYISGTTNYNILQNKPSIENVELVGNKTFSQLGLQAVTPQDIDDMLYGIGD